METEGVIGLKSQSSGCLLEETGKEASFDTFKRVLKKSLRVETLPTISQGKTQ